jgi:hypothetical protein
MAEQRENRTSLSTILSTFCLQQKPLFAHLIQFCKLAPSAAEAEWGKGLVFGKA